jgi:hypothetical protein
MALSRVSEEELPASDRLTMSAPWSTAQRMPDATEAAEPLPFTSSERTGRMRQPQQ